MKYTVFITVVCVLLFSANAFALKCDKCHKDEKALPKILKDKAINTKQDLLNSLRNGPKARLHQHLTDDEISQAAKEMGLK